MLSTDCGGGGGEKSLIYLQMLIRCLPHTPFTRPQLPPPPIQPSHVEARYTDRLPSRWFSDFPGEIGFGILKCAEHIFAVHKHICPCICSPPKTQTLQFERLSFYSSSSVAMNGQTGSNPLLLLVMFRTQPSNLMSSLRSKMNKSEAQSQKNRCETYWNMNLQRQIIECQYSVKWLWR